MLVIRFQRTGRRNVPTFRLVVAEKSRAAKGKVVEFLGHYLPARDPHVFAFEQARIEHWLKIGAQPSDTAARLLAKAGMKNLEKFIVRYAKQKKKGEEEAAAEAPAAAAPKAATPPKEEEKKEEVKEEKKDVPAEGAKGGDSAKEAA